MFASLGYLFKNIFKKVDYILLSIICVLAVFSTLTLYTYEADSIFYIKQSLWAVISVIVFIIVGRIDFSFLKNTNLVLIFYIISNFLLLATLFFGVKINGAKAWLSFGFMSFQPADLAKLALIVLLAKYFSKRHLEIKSLRHVIVSFFYTAIPFAIIMFQPDLGSGIVILFIWFLILFVSGLSKKHIIALFLSGMFVFGLAWNFALADYQKNRILNLIEPLRDISGSGYNVYQAQIAIGSGGLYGKGVGFGTQSRLDFLPEHETDFIFSAFAEEWGFIGVVILFFIYFILLIRILYIAYISQNNFFAIIAMGIFAFIFIHTFINISMNLGLFPVTGLPLPLLSYGGSHFLIVCICFGLLSSISSSAFNIKKKINNEFLGLE
jgi:rod shape determining protein RodA